jgi:hypothetical protein
MDQSIIYTIKNVKYIKLQHLNVNIGLSNSLNPKAQIFTGFWRGIPG